MSRDEKSSGPSIFQDVISMMNRAASSKTLSSEKYDRLRIQLNEAADKLIRHVNARTASSMSYRSFKVLNVQRGYVNVLISYSIMSFDVAVACGSSYDVFESNWVTRVSHLHILAMRAINALNEEKYSDVKEPIETILTEYFTEFNRRPQAPYLLFEWIINTMDVDLIQLLCSVWKRRRERDAKSRLVPHEILLVNRGLRRMSRTEGFPIDLYTFARSHGVNLSGFEMVWDTVKTSVSGVMIPDLAKLVAEFTVCK